MRKSDIAEVIRRWFMSGREAVYVRLKNGNYMWDWASNIEEEN